jgi:hypothetical protein
MLIKAFYGLKFWARWHERLSAVLKDMGFHLAMLTLMCG